MVTDLEGRGGLRTPLPGQGRTPRSTAFTDLTSNHVTDAEGWIRRVGVETEDTGDPGVDNVGERQEKPRFVHI